MAIKSVADIVGPWVDPDLNSGLIDRCRRNWTVPIDELSNEMLATFLRQEIATELVLDIAVARLEAGFDDDTELYEGELANAVNLARERIAKNK